MLRGHTEILIRIGDADLEKGGLGYGWTGLNIHLVIFEDGGAEFLLDVADAVWRCMSRHVRGDGKSWVEYKRAGFAGWLLARYSVMESCVFITYGIGEACL